jgi:hypothetical protein
MVLFWIRRSRLVCDLKIKKSEIMTHKHQPHHYHKQGTLEHPGLGQTAAASGDPDHNGPSVSADDIRLCAYRKWESAGKPAGDGAQFWLQAEQELKQGN